MFIPTTHHSPFYPGSPGQGANSFHPIIAPVSSSSLHPSSSHLDQPNRLSSKEARRPFESCRKRRTKQGHRPRALWPRIPLPPPLCSSPHHANLGCLPINRREPFAPFLCLSSAARNGWLLVLSLVWSLAIWRRPSGPMRLFRGMRPKHCIARAPAGCIGTNHSRSRYSTRLEMHPSRPHDLMHSLSHALWDTSHI